MDDAAGCKAQFVGSRRSFILLNGQNNKSFRNLMCCHVLWNEGPLKNSPWELEHERGVHACLTLTAHDSSKGPSMQNAGASENCVLGRPSESQCRLFYLDLYLERVTFFEPLPPVRSLGRHR